MRSAANQNNNPWTALHYRNSQAMRTSSRIRVWILTRWYGYRVTGMSLVPQGTLFGLDRCKKTWALMPPE